MAIRVEIQGDVVIQRFVCPRCGSARFELLSLGIPGTGTSVCLNCRYPVAVWAHDEPLNSRLDFVIP